MSSVKVLHLSAYDFGGAGMAAYRLHCTLRAAGFQSRMVVCKKKGTDDDVLELSGGKSFSRFRAMLSKVWLRISSDQDYYFQHQSSSLLPPPDALLERMDFKPDVIIVHWVSGCISPEDIKALSLIYRVPVIWYLLDMAPLTGGCHYAWDCSGYCRECGMCPALGSINLCDRSHRIWQNKHLALQGIDLTVVAGSGWLERQAERSSLFHDRPIHKILLCVDPDVFSPGSISDARSRLGLPEDKKIIFFGNQGLGLKRKGMTRLVEALQRLAADPVFDKEQVMVAVAGSPPHDFDLPLEYISLGFLGTDEMLALAYRAADVFVCPSIEDSGPMMINESIMCGTPVVSFEMGVAPDLVHTAITGYRAKLGDIGDLAHGIKYILDLTSDDALKMSRNCRETGLEHCHPDRQVEAFKALVEEGTRAYAVEVD